MCRFVFNGSNEKVVVVPILTVYKRVLKLTGSTLIVQDHDILAVL